MNQRTGLTRYYQIAGAEEFSAMSSAEGKVQNLGYNATFPILLNISGEPTYFISLKDSAGLVKMYAMVNIQKYTLVATANTVEECEKSYKDMLVSNNITEAEPDKPVYEKTKTVTGTITRIAQTVVSGNSHYYIVLDNSGKYMTLTSRKTSQSFSPNAGDRITFEYADTDDELKTVISIK